MILGSQLLPLEAPQTLSNFFLATVSSCNTSFHTVGQKRSGVFLLRGKTVGESKSTCLASMSENLCKCHKKQWSYTQSGRVLS